jgi:hypothetical protein
LFSSVLIKTIARRLKSYEVLTNLSAQVEKITLKKHKDKLYHNLWSSQTAKPMEGQPGEDEPRDRG